jgi:ditrans,polycis-polyprenyl diphosphate synthase
MVIDCISGSDGKEGIAKAASLLCSTYLNGKKKPVFTEADMANALKAVGMLETIFFSHAHSI